MPKRTHILLILIGLYLTSAGLLMAQTETAVPNTPEPTPTVRPIELTCDLDALLEQEAEYHAQLENFVADAEENPGLALDNLFRVGAAYQELALQCGYIPADAATRAVGTDVDRILLLLDEVNGDPINGQLLYNVDYACAGCHEGENHVGPITEGTYTRVEDTRLADPHLEGYTVEQYLVESIVQPGNYVVPGYQNIMLNNFGERLTLQELADLLTYVESQDGPSPE